MRLWGQVLRKYLREIQGRRDQCFGGFNTYGEPPHVWIDNSHSAATQDEGGRSVRCVVTSAPPSQFVVSVRSTIVLNVLTPILVEIILCLLIKIACF